MTSFLVQFINLLVTVFYIGILARVLLSWFPIGPDSAIMPVVRVVYQITEPILAPIRRILPDMGAIDLSPMIAIIVLIIVQTGHLDAAVTGRFVEVSLPFSSASSIPSTRTTLLRDVCPRMIETLDSGHVQPTREELDGGGVGFAPVGGSGHPDRDGAII